MRPELHQPRELGAVLDLLLEHGDEAVLVGGATELAPLLSRGRSPASHLVILRHVDELQGVAVRPDGGLWLGGSSSHRMLEYSPAVRRFCRPLARMFGLIGSIRIRNQGTLGGNLASAQPSYDPPPFLIALGAQIQLDGPRGPKTVPLSMYLDDAVRQDLILGVVLPPPVSGFRSFYNRVPHLGVRGPSSLHVAVVATVNPDGSCETAQIVLGGVTSRPTGSDTPARWVVVQVPEEGSFRDAGRLAADLVDTEKGGRAGPFIRNLVAVTTERALAAVLSPPTNPERVQA